MNILIISRLYIPCYDAIGIEISNLAENFIKSGHNVTVLCMRVKGQNNNEIINNVNVLRINCTKKQQFKNYLHEFIIFIYKIRLILRKINYDILFVDGLWPSGLSTLYIDLKGKLFIQSSGKDMPNSDKNLKCLYFLLMPFLKKIVTKSTNLIVHSINQEKLAKNVFEKKKIFLIPNGTDSEIYNYAKKNNCSKKKHILYLGSYEKIKGLEFYLKAIDKIIITGAISIDWKFVFVGIGLLEVEVLKMSNKYPQNVYIYGRLDGEEKWNILEESEIFILPSYSESGPRTISEAMAAGCAILTTDVGDVRSKIGENAIYFDNNNVDDFIEKIKILTNDSQLREKLKYNSKKMAMYLPTWENISSQYIDLFSKSK